MDNYLPLYGKYIKEELCKYDIIKDDREDLVNELWITYDDIIKEYKKGKGRKRTRKTKKGKIIKLEKIEHIKAYLFRCLDNRVKKYFRELNKSTRINDNTVIALPEGAENWIYDMRDNDKITYRHNGKTEIMIQHDREVDEQCLKCLNDIQRKIIDLYYNMNLTNDEIGKFYNISVSTVKRIKREALLILRNCMNGE